MSYLLVLTFFALVGSISFLGINEPVTLSAEELPSFVRQLAKEAFLEGRTIMNKNDKGQIESVSGSKWQDLEILVLSSIWIKEIERLKGLKK
jgi:hypothetical protein